VERSVLLGDLVASDTTDDLDEVIEAGRRLRVLGLLALLALVVSTSPTGHGIERTFGKSV
jgi:hypothetical protein